MKIMMVITGMRSGGAERVMATLCNELGKNHTVRLLTMKQAVSDYELAEYVEFIGGNVTNQNAIKSIMFVRRQMEQWKPDVVLSFMTKSNIIALTARKATGFRPPIVIAERANPYYTRKVLRAIRKMLYPSASGCVFQTEQAKAYYKDILKCKSIVLKNPLNPDFNIEPFEGKRKKKIVTMGRLSEEKNQKLLLEAFRQIADQYSEYTVEIYGEGPLRPILETYIHEHNLSDRVTLMGRKNHVQEYIRDAEIFVLPSNSEGMPNALLEAMAMGLACVSTDCPIGGPAVIVRDGENGLLVPTGDVQAMSRAMEKIMCDPVFAEKIAKAARNVIDDFETEKVCAEWEKYLRTIAE